MEEPNELATYGRTFGCEQGETRWDEVAEGLGCHGEYVDRIDQLAPALTRARESGKPSVICLRTDRDANRSIPAAMAAGIGEASAIVCSGVLIGQEAPRDKRGVVIGVFGLAGSVGMICLTSLGGLLFDRFAGGAPFLMMAVVNGLAFGALLTLGARSHSAGTGSPGRSAS